MGDQLTNKDVRVTEFISKDEVIDLIEKVLMTPPKRDGSKSQAIRIYEGIRGMNGIRLEDFI